MRKLMWIVLAVASPFLPQRLPAAGQPPVEWIDPDTGHRIIRLSVEGGSESLYFHQNPFTAKGDEMLMVTPEGLSTVNLKTRRIKLVVPGISPSTNVAHGIILGRKSRLVYYVRRDAASRLAAYSTDIDTRISRKIGEIPGPGGSLLTVNADETLLAGSFVEQSPGSRPSPLMHLPPGQSKGVWMLHRLEAHLPMALFTMDIKTGRVRTFNHSTDWLNHVQFSPTDPSLLMFCHEGPWQMVDRTWIIRSDGTGLQLVHPRRMENEIEGHEFFNWDGTWIYYDLQTPRGEDFWLAGYQIATGARTWYHLQRDEWSVHYNVSPDGKLFAGDGGDEHSVARAKNGKWIYLFRPEEVHINEGARAPRNPKLIHPMVFRAERLVNMARHNYRLEPNVHFTPEGKWIVFRSNMFGPSHVFEVEVARSAPADRSAAQ